MQSFPPSHIPEDILPNDHARQSSAMKLITEIKETGIQFQAMLNLGCCTDNSKQSIQRLYPDIHWTGVDLISSPEVNIRLSNVPGVCAFDGIHFPFNSNCFDLIFSRQVLEHVMEPISLLKEVERVTQPGGLFVGSLSQLEPYHSFSMFNWTPYAINNVFNLVGFDLLLFRPGIDVFTLTVRSLSMAHWFSQFFENESPVNMTVSLLGRILRKRISSVNAIKLRITGHLYFVARKM